MVAPHFSLALYTILRFTVVRKMNAKIRESESKVNEEALEIARKAIRKYDKLLRSLAYK